MTSPLWTFTKLGKDYSALMGQKVKIIFKNGKTNDVLGVYATEDNTVYNTVMNAVEKDGSKSSSMVSPTPLRAPSRSMSTALVLQRLKAIAKKTDFTVDDFVDTTTKTASLLNGSRVVYGKDTTADIHSVANRISADEVKFIDSNDNDKIHTAIITTVDVVKATYVSSTEIVAGSNTYKFEDENISKDIKKDDYVAIRKDLYGDCLNIVPAEKLSAAKVTGTKTAPNQYLIGGTWYVEGQNAAMNSVKSGDTVNAYVVNGVAFYAKRTSGENSTLSDVAVVLAVGTDIQGDKAKILKMDKTGSTEIVDIDNDPGAGYVAKASLKKGGVYEYSIKSGEYRFKELSTSKDYFGDYTALMQGKTAPDTASAGMTISNVSATDTTKKFGDAIVDDSAKIILITGYGTDSTDYKVITGKQFKSLAVGSETNNALTKGGIAAFTSKVDGVTRVTYGVVAVNGIANSFKTNDNYGYVTSDSYTVDGGYVVYNIWTGTEEVTVQEKGTIQRTKGTVLGYSSITKEEGLSDGVVGTIEDVDNNFGLVDNGVVYGVNDKQDKVSLDGKNTNKITSDTVVLYVDTDAHKGYTEGTIQEADDFGTGKIPNVMYKIDGTAADDDLALIVVDVKNNLHGSFNFVFGADATKTDLENALAKADKITVEAAAIRNAGEITVKANKTVIVTAEDKNLSNVFANLKGKTGAILIAKDGGAADKGYSAAYKTDGKTAYGDSEIPAGTIFKMTDGKWTAQAAK